MNRSKVWDWSCRTPIQHSNQELLVRQESWIIWHGQGLVLMPGNSQNFLWLSTAGGLLHHLAHPARLLQKAQHKLQKGEGQDTHSLTFDFQHLHTILSKAPRTDSTTHCVPASLYCKSSKYRQ